MDKEAEQDVEPWTVVEVELPESVYLDIKARADAVGIAVGDYVEQAIQFAMQAEDLPDLPTAA